MLALPEFDTSGTLRQYALHPHSGMAKLRLHLLKERALRACLWDAFCQRPKPERLRELMYLRLGVTNRNMPQSVAAPGAQAPPAVGKRLADMTDHEAALMYQAACKQLGLKFDLPASMKTDAGDTHDRAKQQ